MVKLLIFKILLVCSLASYAQIQDDNWNIDLPFDNSEYWAHDENRIRFMKEYFNPKSQRLMRSHFSQGLSDIEHTEILSQLGITHEHRKEASYSLIDLNKDGKLDVLSFYIFGADGPILRIWLNRDNTLDLVVNEPLGIPQLIYSSDTYTELIVYKSGYFGALTSSIQSFRFDGIEVSKNEVEFQVSTEFPEETSFITRFETINDNYNLRYLPIVKDAPCEEHAIPEDVVCGSKYITIDAGTKGRSYGTKTDDTGRIWWFSVIETQGVGLPLQAGWLSSRYVKKY